ncbi:MAG: hypothetical protein OXR68_00070 [Alphaproteobacteria bacterium]|nr:hypothetical protein [Alphaproteobacteria bacterium]MDD9919006.1 hypothetical protein [Alphaproteobacteria bacterium]
MDKVIITTNEEGTLAIHTLAPVLFDKLDAAAAQEKLEKLIPTGGVAVDRSSIPAYSRFQEALELVDGSVQLNMDKAKTARNAELVKEIYAKLDKLDTKIIRPLGEGDTDRVAAINAQKQAIRNILANPLVAFEGGDIEELAAYTPAELEV